MTTKTPGPDQTFYATRDFKDVGTGKAFAAATEVIATPGEIENYRAAGLVTTDKPKAA